MNLRRATDADAGLLLEWRNDPQTRSSSLTQAPVDPAEHARWLARRRADPSTLLLIAEQDGVPVGTVRLERDGDDAEIHITVAPEARGRGLAAPMLTAAVAQWPADRVVARVRRENEASLRAFARAGFTPAGEDDGVVRLELRS